MDPGSLDGREAGCTRRQQFIGLFGAALLQTEGLPFFFYPGSSPGGVANCISTPRIDVRKNNPWTEQISLD